jgi:tRNA(Arg) A34 adenosine deaminase TadA
MNNTEFTQQDREFMQMAIDLSIENVANGGGPFGAVIVRNGEVIATGTNRVTANNDPTAHAEVSAIRVACAKVQNFKLDGCTCYTSCEPCPMCLSALYWAGIERIVYGNTKEDAKAINFDDSFIYDEIAKPYALRAIPCQNLMRNEALAGFQAWSDKEDKIEY